MQNENPNIAKGAVLVNSQPMPEGSVEARGYDFHDGINYEALFSSFAQTGFQATNFSKACDEINRMLQWRLSDEPIAEDEDEELKDPEARAQVKCKIFFGYTSNLVSAGTRETIKFLAQHNLIDCIVTTAGGVEEDLIKCMAPTYLGDFRLDGVTLRNKGINRIGNLLVPNDNYCKFEDFMKPILLDMRQMQRDQGVNWTPSKMIQLLGERINNPESIYYWTSKHNIPVLCPALTDGSIGDMVYFDTFDDELPQLRLDLVEDIRRINLLAMKARKTGMLICGGGIIKHHICNANLMRNGADFSVFVNTATEFDGSDAGARPDEAKSWGKIAAHANPVKLYGENSIMLPLLVSQTFARVVHH